MPLDIELEQGEHLTFHEVFAPSKKVEPVVLGVSDRAVFVSRKKTFAVRDPWSIERVPLGQITEVELRDVRPYLIYVVAGLLVAVGLVTSILVVLSIVNRTGGFRSGYPFGVLAVGLVLPFIAKRRRLLRVGMVSSEFRWLPPLTVDSAPRRAASTIQRRFVDACKNVGVRVIDGAA